MFFDEFSSFLRKTGLKSICNNLNSEDREKFKNACYTGFSINSDGTTNRGELTLIREREKLLYLIPHNLIGRKEYNLAIKLLNEGFKLVKTKEDMAQYHIGYALAYEKLKDIDKCNRHCWEAINLLHSGTYAYERLIKNYVKLKEYNKALEVCNLVLERENVFNKPTWNSLSAYVTKRKEFILKQLNKQKE